MVAALKFLLKFLRKLFCKLWGFIPRCFNFKSWALILAFLARKFGLWRTWNKGKGTLRRSEQAEQTFPGTGALTGVRLDEGQDQAIACSAIPASARHPIQQDSLTVPAQLASSSKATHPGPANLTERHKRDHPQDYPPLEFDAGMHSNRSCASIQSGASDRLSRIIQSQSHESLHSSLGQPKENLKADQVVDVHVHCRAESSASVVVELENPSTALLPRSELVGSPNVHSSPASKSRTLNLPEESPQITPTAPLILDLNLPDHRRLQMIKSNDIPRYSKQFTVPRERRNYDINPLTTKFPHVPENRDNGVEKGTPEADCTPWKAATHPDGALYFFNEERVRALEPLQVSSCDQPTVEEVVH
ncbi:hypothetical protein EI94DRAFT_1801076 [Lactarius quietus]|nr:hypothetical protein EI94DRAFT_1801076 [Lactarius quietus]